MRWEFLGGGGGVWLILCVNLTGPRSTRHYSGNVCEGVSV